MGVSRMFRWAKVRGCIARKDSIAREPGRQMVEWALVSRCERRLDKGLREQEQGMWCMRERYNDGGCGSTVGNMYVFWSSKSRECV